MRRADLNRWPYLALAYACLGLGTVGVAVPGLPTVPFLLLAAWAAERGSPRLRQRLLEHPRFGPALAAWRHERAISTRAKLTAVLLLSVSWLLLAWFDPHPLAPALAGVLFVALGAFLVTRPAPGRAERRG